MSTRIPHPSAPQMPVSGVLRFAVDKAFTHACYLSNPVCSQQTAYFVPTDGFWVMLSRDNPFRQIAERQSYSINIQSNLIRYTGEPLTLHKQRITLLNSGHVRMQQATNATRTQFTIRSYAESPKVEHDTPFITCSKHNGLIDAFKNVAVSTLNMVIKSQRLCLVTLENV